MSERSVLDLLYASHRRLAELEATPRDFGTGDLLYSSDIHTVAAIGRNEGCNLTVLASELQVSIPAAFKFTSKLVRSGYVSKSRLDGNGKEVVFTLTEKGRRAVLAHDAYRTKVFAPLSALEAELPAGDRLVIGRFLSALERSCSW
jgi:DNA-binding MarR family transcriptional regulator